MYTPWYTKIWCFEHKGDQMIREFPLFTGNFTASEADLNRLVNQTNLISNFVNALVGGVGTVTSVNASGGSTGLSFTGGPVTTMGTLTLSGTLDSSHGGTGVANTGTLTFSGSA